MKEAWVVAAKRADFQKIGARFSIDPVIARIIRNRDIIEENEMEKYLFGGLERLGDPEKMKDLQKGGRLLMEKIAKGAKIRIIGDYDIDGVCSTYILYKGLTILGAKADTCLPDRVTDGYGLNANLIQRAREDGIDTIVTCDNGIAAYHEVKMAKDFGMTVIITDHHEIPFEETAQGKRERIPLADAVLDPWQEACPYAFKKLCGAGVAYHLITWLFGQMGQKNIPEEFLELTAVATVGDVMDLQGENRILVKEGLKRMQNPSNLGLKALIAANHLDDRQIFASHIGFTLGPCINASGRLDTAQRALELLKERDEKKARRLAEDLVAMNASRKALTEKGVVEAVRLVEEEQLLGQRVLVLYLPDCHESLAGIIAGRLRERYYRPVLVLTRSAQGAKGSGRSIEGYHMFQELNACKDLFEKFGGHAMAAGLSMQEDKINELRIRLNENCTLTAKELTPKVYIDVPMPISYVTKELVEQLHLLEPFGKGNTKPVFAQKGISLLDCRIYGKNQNVVKMKLKDASGCIREGIYFGDVQALLARAAKEAPLSIAYYPCINRYQQREELQFTILHYQ